MKRTVRKVSKKIALNLGGATLAALSAFASVDAARAEGGRNHVQFSYASCQRIRSPHVLSYNDGAVLQSTVLAQTEDTVACPVTIPFGITGQARPRRIDLRYRYISSTPSDDLVFRCRVELRTSDPGAGGMTGWVQNVVSPPSAPVQGTLSIELDTAVSMGGYALPWLSAAFVNSLTLRCSVPGAGRGAIDGYALVYDQ